MFTHQYPNFLIKNWKAKPWSKIEQRRVKYNKQRHMGQKNYYPLELEKKLSIVEQQISIIFKKIDEFKGGQFEFTHVEWFKIILYCKIQAIRLENIVHYINQPDEFFPGNNNFLFGVFTTDNKKEALSLTNVYCDEFLKSNKGIDEFQESVVSALGIVIWKNNFKSFVATENALFKEVDIDGNFLFIYLPISPQTAVVISKNSYFSSVDNLEYTKRRNGDSRVAMSIKDDFLINGFSHEGMFHLPFIHAAPKRIPVYYGSSEYDSIINAMCKDSKKIIFSEESDKKLKSRMKSKDFAREIELDPIQIPFF